MSFPIIKLPLLELFLLFLSLALRMLVLCLLCCCLFIFFFFPSCKWLNLGLGRSELTESFLPQKSSVQGFTTGGLKWYSKTLLVYNVWVTDGGLKRVLQGVLASENAARAGGCRTCYHVMRTRAVLLWATCSPLHQSLWLPACRKKHITYWGF